MHPKWGCARRMIKCHPLLMADSQTIEKSEFEVSWRVHPAFVEVLFGHREGAALGFEITSANLRRGKAVSGDGMPFGDVTRDVRAVLYDPARVDLTTVMADYVVPIGPHQHAALIATWRTEGEDGVLAVAGIVLTATDGQYQVRGLQEPDQAAEFISEAGMIIPGWSPTVLSPVSPDSYPHFTELSVAGYRGFGEQRTLLLAKPSGEPGSGLTVIVGANNSGKSTFLEAIQVIARARQQPDLTFPQPRRHRDLDSVSIELARSDGRRLKVQSTRVGSSQAQAAWFPDDGPPDRFDIQVTPSRRSFTPYFGSVGMADRNWGINEQEFSRTQLRDQFVGRLRKVDRDAQARVVFDGLLEEIMGRKLNWTIDEISQNQQFLKLTESNGAWHTSEGLGDGLISLLFIVDALYDSSPGSLIAIDEPELSLHPQLVRRLGRVLSRFSRDRQIVIATHSPLLVEWSDISNGAEVARVFKVDGRSEIARASAETLQAVAQLADSRNLVNPHTVGLVAREALFLEDGVILTEGQDDVAYLPRVLEDLALPQSDNMYGWGAGGVGNIPPLAQLFKELGFTKIGAILDDDGQPGTQAAVERLSSMGPEVLVRQLPAPDIRYKKPVKARPAIVGLLDADNRHVRSELRVETARVLREVLDHVSTDHNPVEPEGSGEPPQTAGG
ncbi:hypothetical protein BH10ACT7_BH10ACT7_15970 [soil metagenome]